MKEKILRHTHNLKTKTGKDENRHSHMSETMPTMPALNGGCIDASSLVIGKTRVRDEDGFCATVRYVGPVASAKKNKDETYVGVEWDDPSRGKHDGSVVSRATQELVRHFVCEKAGLCGSFLRLHKVDLGQTLSEEVLQEKYVGLDAPLVAPNNVLPGAFAMTSGGHKKPIELLGELKIRERQQVESLTSIALRNQGIVRVSSTLNGPHVLELDVGRNLFSDWDVVLTDLLRAFPNLEALSLASNRLGDIEQRQSGESEGCDQEGTIPAVPTGSTAPASALAPADTQDDTQKDNTFSTQYPSLRTLNLHSCGITSVHTLLLLGEIFPNLKDLCAASNPLGNGTSNVGTTSVPAVISTTATSDAFNSLTSLDMSACGWTDWTQDIVPWSALPNLETLHLQDNDFPCIPVPRRNVGSTTTPNMNTGAKGSPYFPTLRYLSMSNLGVSSWTDLGGLSSLPSLTSLVIRGTPLTKSMGAAEARAHLIARFENLAMLNSSSISGKERAEAEKRYVYHVRHLLLLRQQPVKSDQNHDNNDGENDAKKKKNNKNNKNQNSAEDSRKDEIASFLATEHPQYERLITKHPVPTAQHPSNGNGPNGSSLSSSHTYALNVTITPMAPSSCHLEAMHKRLPSTLTVGRVKSLCAKAFELDYDLQLLHFRQKDTSGSFPIPLDDDDATLGYMGVTDGCEILVNEIDLRESERSLQKEKDAYEERWKEQEQHIDSIQRFKKTHG